jgi:hypothetical protein
MKTRSCKNNNNNNGDEHQQPQLRRRTRKRKLNELAIVDKPAEGEDKQEEGSSSKMNCKEKNDQDLEVCRLEKRKLVSDMPKINNIGLSTLHIGI